MDRGPPRRHRCPGNSYRSLGAVGARLGMGVAGLLEALAVEAEEVVWPGKVRGAAIGIDISVWLHELATRHYQSVVLLKKYDD